MKVMYTCDNNYVWLMGISMISLFDNNKDIKELKVYLLGENISKENRDVLKKIAIEYARELEIIDVPTIDIPTSLISTRWPKSAFTRLFSGQILPTDINSILYLDCDTIISGDISELENVRFNGNIALGVKDCISGTYKKNIGLDKNSTYINAGVILFDMKALRNIDIENEIEVYMQKRVKVINYADQDILNGIFKGYIGELSPKFDIMTIDVAHTYEELVKLRKPTNYYKKDEFEEAKASPAIIHYTTHMLIIRPWYSNTTHPMADVFLKYMSMSPWKNRKLSKMTFSTKEEKVIKMVMRLPKNVAYGVLGVIHAELRPRFIKMRAGR